jgi:hypothetical protein
MTKLFQEAMTKASTELTPNDQDRFAQFLIANVGRLHDLIDDVIEEYVFDKQVVAAIESEPVQRLLKQVAEKHQTQYAR